MAKVTRKPQVTNRKLRTPGRLRLFDQATERQKGRQRNLGRRKTGTNHGWRREGLYRRGRAVTVKT